MTIVDILRRQRAVDLIVSRGKNMIPKQQKIPEGKLHASVGIPAKFLEANKKKDMNAVKVNNAVFSYNIFVVLGMPRAPTLHRHFPIKAFETARSGQSACLCSDWFV